jgi:predicted ATPase
MLTKLEIHNYKSIYDATIELEPFTLLIGANGTGKSNLVSLLEELSQGVKENVVNAFRGRTDVYMYKNLEKHLSFLHEDQYMTITHSSGREFELENGSLYAKNRLEESTAIDLPLSVTFPLDEFPLDFNVKNSRVFRLAPSRVGGSEKIVVHPIVQEDGYGVVQVLDSLKTGDREDLFLKIEDQLGKYIPEIEKISFIPEQNAKKLQVREKYIPKPVPVEMLSEGTKLVLAILTILYQEHPPSLVCIEDIDRGLHPRLFQQIVELCNDLSRKLNIQIIATTHNPYILDEFVGNESAVVIVEKKEGCTTFTTLAERLAQVQDNGEEMPLGAVWYSGLVGGVPKR